MSTDVNTLMEMGFPQQRAERALFKTGYKGAQVAMDWIFAHDGDADIDDPFELPKGHTLSDTVTVEGESAGGDPGSEGASTAADAQAKSLKCEDCGKLLRTTEAAELHANRTGHANFSESTDEIKPLSADEKEKQMVLLQEKLKKKREDKEEEEKQERIKREKLRRTQGRDRTSAKQKFEEDEMRKLAEFKKKEKQEDKAARQRVLDQIERDKRDRAGKFGKSVPPPASPAPTPAAATSPPVQKSYDDCTLQIRLTDGGTLTHKFSALEQLAAVRLFVEMNRTDGDAPFTLMTTFPKKVFSDEDMQMPLAELGLVPSAVVVVAKRS